MHKLQLHTAVFGDLIEETLLHELLEAVPAEDRDAAVAHIVSLITLTSIQKAYNSLQHSEQKSQFVKDVSLLLSRAMNRSEFFSKYPGSEQIITEQVQRTMLSLNAKKK